MLRRAARTAGRKPPTIVGDGLDPFDLAGHPLGGPLVAVAVDEARERDHAVPHADGDVVISETGLPPQLRDDVFLNLHVGTHDILLRVQWRPAAWQPACRELRGGFVGLAKSSVSVTEGRSV